MIDDHTKPTNPKDFKGLKKVPIFSVVPWGVVGRIALALLEGALKYGRHNYRAQGVLASVYVDGAIRHLAAWWEGEDIDPDSGFSHVDKAIASLVVLSDSMEFQNWRDDRPPKQREGVIQRLNDAVAQIKDRHPNPVPPYTEIGKMEVSRDTVTVSFIGGITSSLPEKPYFYGNDDKSVLYTCPKCDRQQTSPRMICSRIECPGFDEIAKDNAPEPASDKA